MKILTVVGTRPELIRLSSVIEKIEKYCTSILVHTGQNYDKELNKFFFDDLNIKSPKYNFNLKKNTSIESISEIIKLVDNVIKIEKPDAFLILGDTNSCLSAYCAKRAKIPIFHIEAGNRSYDLRVPEEINRKIIDHLSDVNITYSERAKDNLLRENIDPEKIFNIGSPLHEVFLNNKLKIQKSKIIEKLKLKKNKYYVMSIHREENLDIDKNFKKFIEFTTNFLSKSKFKLIFSTHPRTKKKLEKLNIFKNNKKILFHAPFNYTDYMKLQMNSTMVLSDSGSITEEASICGFNAINLRQTYERQEGMSYGVAPLIFFDFDKVLTIEKIIKSRKTHPIIPEYLNENFSEDFINILFSYIDYVNYYNWKK